MKINLKIMNIYQKIFISQIFEKIIKNFKLVLVKGYDVGMFIFFKI